MVNRPIRSRFLDRGYPKLYSRGPETSSERECLVSASDANVLQQEKKIGRSSAG